MNEKPLYGLYDKFYYSVAPYLYGGMMFSIQSFPKIAQYSMKTILFQFN